MIGDPPSEGAVQETLAEASAPPATTPVGAAGAVGVDEDVEGLSTRMVVSQGVRGPVPKVALGVAPVVVRVWSSARSSMSGVGERLTRGVQPVPGVRVSEKPESA